MHHLTRDQCEAGLDEIRAAPKDEGVLQMIVRRPRVNAREVLDAGELDLAAGLVGDTWSVRPSLRTTDGTPHPEMQLNIMNARVTDLLAGSRERWALAGDQLYVDLDISEANLPPGTRLAVGSAEIEVTPLPHLGCAKFVERFGLDAMKFVNSPLGRQLRLRGMNARVVRPGTIRVGDIVRKM
jgi:hypothetical protein